jgi:uncharacterized protein (DUF1015 family)
MANIFPFRAVRYTAQAGDPADLLTQPYDKIPDDLREEYYRASAYNFVRLIKAKPEPDDNDSNNVYTRAASSLSDWLDGSFLAQDDAPSFYPYFQEFPHPDTGETFVRKGFIGLTELAEYSEGIVHGHELTHKGPKLDRLQLTRHTRTHFGQLFMLYDDPERQIDSLLDEAAAGEPLVEVSESDVIHRMWRVSDPATVARIQQAMADKKLMVADGHHRYETALTYRRENSNLPGADRAMMTYVNMSSEGLVVLATHRVLAGLAGFDAAAVRSRASADFDITRLDSPSELETALATAPADQSSIGAVFADDPAAYLFTVKPVALDRLASNLTATELSLDVVVLHKALLAPALGVSEQDVLELKNISYVRGFQAAVEQVSSGAAQVAFLLRPVSVQKVAEISFSGGVMPQKSTDFYPKLLAGLTSYKFG